jgi:hypothetical protein
MRVDDSSRSVGVDSTACAVSAGQLRIAPHRNLYTTRTDLALISAAGQPACSVT